MRYFDTSFLVPVFIAERTTAQVEKILSRQPAGEMAVSEWTQVEFSSALGRQVRIGDLDEATARQIEERFDTLISSTFLVLAPVTADFDLARRLIGRYEAGLRAGDALHLAIASNNGAQAIYSLDKGLVAAGRKLGMPVRTGIPVS